MKKAGILLVLACVLFGVLYHFFFSPSRVRVENRFDSIDCSIEVSLQNTENKQILLAQEVLSKQNLVKEFEKTIPADAHITITLNGETALETGYIDSSVSSIAIHIKVVDYDQETGQVTLRCQSRIGLTTATETITATVSKGSPALGNPLIF